MELFLSCRKARPDRLTFSGYALPILGMEAF